MGIQPGTQLKVLDNSGAKTVKCITQSYQHGASLTVGHQITAVVTALTKRSSGGKSSLSDRKTKTTLRRGEKVRAVIVQTTKADRSMLDGGRSSFGTNGVVLLTPLGHLRGTRILDPVPLSLRAKTEKYGVKILSLTKKAIA